MEKDDSFKINLPKVDVPDIKFPSTNSLMRDLSNEMALHHNLKQAKENDQISRELKQIELLEGIRDNTGSLVNIVDMIRFNSDQQTEILSIIADIMVLGAFEDKTEAESSFRKIMNDINQKIEDTESMIKLSDVAKMTWAYVKITYFGG